MARKSEYKVANYEGGLAELPTAQSAGKVALDTNDSWTLSFGLGKHARGSLREFPFEVAPSGETACLVTVRCVRDANFGVRFGLPETSAAALCSDLDERGCGIAQVMAAAGALQQRIAAGEWWADLAEYRILKDVHFSGLASKARPATYGPPGRASSTAS